VDSTLQPGQQENLLLTQAFNWRSPGAGLHRSLFTTVTAVIVHTFIFIFIVINEAVHIILVTAAIIHTFVVLVVKDLLKRVVSGSRLFVVIAVFLSALLQAFEFLNAVK
jgi:hypothetical protein